MNRQLSNKPSKKDRPRSTGKTGEFTILVRVRINRGLIPSKERVVNSLRVVKCVAVFLIEMILHFVDKSAKPKKRGDQTPEKAATPVPSSAGLADERGQGNQAINNVLSGEDIDSLAVNIEELQKVSFISFLWPIFWLH